MAAERSAYLGPRVRRLRRDLGLTQPDLAAALEISASYVSLIESNQRPMTAELLLRLARTYRIDLSAFAGDGGEAFTQRLQTTLKDPLFADLDLPRLQSADVAANYPQITEAFLRLHSAYRAEQRVIAAGGETAGETGDDDPVGQLRRVLQARRNHFPALDEAAETLAASVEASGGLQPYLEATFRLRVRRLPPTVLAGQLRRYDPHHRAIFLDESLDGPAATMQLATQLAYLALGSAITTAEDGTGLTGANARRLARRMLATYAGAAIVMPYAAFHRAAEERRYDMEALARRFGVSFEAAAHRLTTLARSGLEGPPLSFIRVDAAGNVSKHYDGAGFPLAEQGGGCPLWTLHHVLRTPSETVVQWLELPDHQRFLSIARVVSTGGGAYGLPRIDRAVALVMAAEHAGRMAYADPAGEPTPIGVTCRLCQRDRCPARALPPLGRQILPDDYHRGRAPLGYADD